MNKFSGTTHHLVGKIAVTVIPHPEGWKAETKARGIGIDLWGVMRPTLYRTIQMSSPKADLAHVNAMKRAIQERMDGQGSLTPVVRERSIA